ncbi:hypothetical protein lerEdw1_012152 [Lerista edwardsae]|nr:hypothetical protein lerEdw1_012152 [Lerista edwardsae]
MDVLQSASFDVLVLARLLGMLTSCQKVITWACFRARGLQRLLLPHQDSISLNNSKRISLDPIARADLRICHCEGDDESPLITPCRCTGTLRFVHQACLHQWIKSSDTRCCELCKYDFIMETKLKPLRKAIPRVIDRALSIQKLHITFCSMRI